MNISLETLLMFAGRLHAVLVHFPIALLLLAALLEAQRFRQAEASPTSRICLGLGSLAAIAAALSGWQFATEGHGSSMPDALFQHRWGGIALAVIASASWLIGSKAIEQGSASMMRAYRIGLFLCAGLVGLVGFRGGAMVWGPEHYSEVFFGETLKHDQDEHGESKSPEGKTELDAAELIPSKVDYASQIQPLFEANCYECHGPTGRAKGSMRLSSRGPLFEGPEDFWIMLPGDAAGSYLIELVSMSATSEDVMPPMQEGAPSKTLSSDQIDLLSRWIDEGAIFGAE